MITVKVMPTHHKTRWQLLIKWEIEGKELPIIFDSRTWWGFRNDAEQARDDLIEELKQNGLWKV